MAVTIDRAFVEQYRSNVHHAYQQKGSRLKKTMYYEPLVGDTHNFELVLAVDAVWKTTNSLPYGPYDRHKDTPVLDTPHARRRCTPTDAEYGDLVDREDKLRLLISPESEYAWAARQCLGRATDDLAVLAQVGDAVEYDLSTTALGNAQSVTDNGTITQTGVATVPTLGLTFDKVNAGLELHNSAEVDEDGKWACVNATGVRHLLNQTKVTSADYGSLQALQAGKIVEGWMGYNWIRTERLYGAAGGPTHPDGANIDDLILTHERAVGLCVNEEMFTRIAERPDKSFAHQVYCRMTKGAMRLWEAGVVRVKYLDTNIPS